MGASPLSHHTPAHPNANSTTLPALPHPSSPQVVILPLQRPELFTRGALTKPTKGLLLFGPPGALLGRGRGGLWPAGRLM